MALHKCFKRVKFVFSAFIKSEIASVLPFAALAFPVVLGMVGLGVDTSYWMAEKRNLQTAADAAVIAAGWEIAQSSEGYMDYAALKEAQNNGYEFAENGELSLQIIQETMDEVVLAINLSQDSQRFFSKVIRGGDVRVAAYAEAEITGVDGRFCILSLDETSPDSVSTFGSVVIDAPDCGIAVNSNDDEAFTMSGNSDVAINTIRISGDYDLGSNVALDYNSLRTGQTPLDDPYADLEVPDYRGCDENNARYSSSARLSPGVYCGGIDVSGDTDVEFEPGVYILDGGDFKVTGNGSLYGEGVTFILTGSGRNVAQLNISGGRDIEFSAPESGEDWSGITFFQDRNASDRDNFQNKLTGSGSILLNGVAYFPSQGLWFGGDATLMSPDTPCTKLIARTVTLAGNPMLGNNCRNYDINDIGLPTVKLIR